MMKSKYVLTKAQKEEIEKARKQNKNKNVEKRLKALNLRAEGKTNKQVAEITNYHPAYVSQLVSTYCTKGLPAITENHYGGNRRNMSREEEAAFLEHIKRKRSKGK